jgi:hypothetical protein
MSAAGFILKLDPSAGFAGSAALVVVGLVRIGERLRNNPPPLIMIARIIRLSFGLLIRRVLLLLIPLILLMIDHILIYLLFLFSFGLVLFCLY